MSEYHWTDEKVMSLSFMKQHLYLDRILARKRRENGNSGDGEDDEPTGTPLPAISGSPPRVQAKQVISLADMASALDRRRF